MKPIIGITIGDATGAGPEIIVKSLEDKGVYDVCRPLIIGDRGIMERAAGIVNIPLKFRSPRSTPGLARLPMNTWPRG